MRSILLKEVEEYLIRFDNLRNKHTDEALLEKKRIIDHIFQFVNQQKNDVQNTLLNTILPLENLFNNTGELKEAFVSFERKERLKSQETQTHTKFETKLDMQLYIRDLLLLKKRSEATEKLVEWFTDQNYVYTILSDEKKEVWIYEDGIYVPNGMSKIQEFVRDILLNLYTTTFANEVIEKIRVDTFVDKNEFFQSENPYRICLLNGIYDFKKKKLCSYNPNEIHFQKINAEFRDDAVCPIIDTFLSQITSSVEDKNILYELVGFCLIKEYFIEKAFMFLGEGRNGKGKYFGLLTQLLGEKNVINIGLSKFESDPFSRCELFGKLANIGADISNTPIKESGFFKELVARDYISAQRKFMTSISFVNYGKMIFSTNQLPYTFDTTPAFFDRWIIIQFNNRFVPEPELKNVPQEDKYRHFLQDPFIEAKITTQDELNGILKIAVEKAHILLERGRFSHSETSASIKDLWIAKTDSLLGFYNSMFVEDIDGSIAKQDFKELYKKYCQEHKTEIFSDVRIKKFMDRKGIWDNQEHNSARNWRGIRLKDSEKTTAVVFKSEKSEMLCKFIKGLPQNNYDLACQMFGEEFIQYSLAQGFIFKSNSKTIKVLG
jgi:P4 family phage/plasmid primase-like protien